MSKPRTAILAGLALLLSGCAGLLTQPPPPPDIFYRLQVPPPAQDLARPALPGVVEVERFTADGLTAERALVYAEGDQGFVLGSYTYHLWTESPTSLLQEALVEYLRQAGAAERVVTPNLRLLSDYVIQGHIRRFEQVLDAGSPEVVVEVELALTDRRTDRLLLLETYKARRRARSAQPRAAVEAMREAVADVYDAFVADLAVVDATT